MESEAKFVPNGEVELLSPLDNTQGIVDSSNGATVRDRRGSRSLGVPSRSRTHSQGGSRSHSKTHSKSSSRNHSKTRSRSHSRSNSESHSGSQSRNSNPHEDPQFDGPTNVRLLPTRVHTQPGASTEEAKVDIPSQSRSRTKSSQKQSKIDIPSPSHSRTKSSQGQSKTLRLPERDQRRGSRRSSSSQKEPTQRKRPSLADAGMDPTRVRSKTTSPDRRRGHLKQPTRAHTDLPPTSNGEHASHKRSSSMQPPGAPGPDGVPLRDSTVPVKTRTRKSTGRRKSKSKSRSRTRTREKRRVSYNPQKDDIDKDLPGPGIIPTMFLLAVLIVGWADLISDLLFIGTIWDIYDSDDMCASIYAKYAVTGLYCLSLLFVVMYMIFCCCLGEESRLAYPVWGLLAIIINPKRNLKRVWWARKDNQIQRMLILEMVFEDGIQCSIALFLTASAVGSVSLDLVYQLTVMKAVVAGLALVLKCPRTVYVYYREHAHDCCTWLKTILATLTTFVVIILILTGSWLLASVPGLKCEVG